jgi:hypothetical protein
LAPRGPGSGAGGDDRVDPGRGDRRVQRSLVRPVLGDERAERVHVAVASAAAISAASARMRASAPGHPGLVGAVGVEHPGDRRRRDARLAVC